MYDYLHRRIGKTIHHPQSAVHSYIYDGWQPVLEIVDSATGTSTNCYYWGKDVSGMPQGAGGVGGLLAVSIDGQYFLPCLDANGEQKSAKLKRQRRATAILRPTQRVGARSRLRRRSANITAYIDEFGTVVASYEYDAFGDTIAQTGSHADIFRFRFSTKYHDSETGFYYYGRRFYDPPWSRWLNRDPIEEDGGLNLYAFCGNDCVNGVDPWGLWRAPRKDDFYGNYLQNLYGKTRRVYRYESGDTLEGLAKKVKLGVDDIAAWARFNTNHSAETTQMLISTEDWRKFCYVSVPNVWIDADLLRGGGPYSRFVNLGGTIGSFIGTDLFVSGKREVVKVKTISGLVSALQKHSGDIWGMTVYGHGGPDGTLAQSGKLNYSDLNVKWINQADLIALISLNNYKLSSINMMQCYSGISLGTYNGKPCNWSAEWKKHTLSFTYYENVNVLGFDMGWDIWPWNW